MGDMATPLLVARDVHGGYQAQDAVLNGASVEVYPGELVAMIGPNGAGKSTFLKALFGMVSIRSGDVSFSGQQVERLRPTQRLKLGMAMCPQGRCNFPAMTVKENLEMGAILLLPSQVKGEIERVTELFPRLRERLQQRAGTMSGGEQQQLEMAMALMGEPKLLLIDEPSLGLDPKNVDIVFHIIATLKTTGVSLLMVEQNAVRALHATDRAYVLEQGRTRMSGSSSEILANQEVRQLYLGGA